MLFNSIDFAIFLPIVFSLYWFVFKSIKSQNVLIVISSYIFYGWWDWRFLSLILFSTIVDYFVGVKLKNENIEQKRKFLLSLSVLTNLGFLGFFKYYNFFLQNFVDAFSFFGFSVSSNSLNIILPVGISFYTFQTLSYTIDVYRKKLAPTTDFISFSAFVCFFPQLVAGPIERATHLLPQFYKSRLFNYEKAVDGMRQILWGLFKKVVIADNCAIYANDIFNNYLEYSGSTLVVGAIFFTFQIYCDFSGYSDIAIGTSRLFGFDLRQNFAFPYFSRNIAEFWRRWHISLSSWFRDYLYIPLGGSKVDLKLRIRNVFIIFIVSGFWHGANWTFIIWGTLNALYFLPVMILNKNRKYLDVVADGKYIPTLKELLQMFMTFMLTVFAWIFFRSENLTQAILIINEIFSSSFFTFPEFGNKRDILFVLLLVISMFVAEWYNKDSKYGIEKFLLNKNRLMRWSFYCLIIVIIFIFKNDADNEFIYFQF